MTKVVDSKGRKRKPSQGAHGPYKKPIRKAPAAEIACPLDGLAGEHWEFWKSELVKARCFESRYLPWMLEAATRYADIRELEAEIQSIGNTITVSTQFGDIHKPNHLRPSLNTARSAYDRVTTYLNGAIKAALASESNAFDPLGGSLADDSDDAI